MRDLYSSEKTRTAMAVGALLVGMIVLSNLFRGIDRTEVANRTLRHESERRSTLAEGATLVSRVEIATASNRASQSNREDNAEVAPVIAGFERFLREAETNEQKARSGQFLFGELNCVACHQPPASVVINAKPAPDLSALAQRVQPEYIGNYLENPHAAKPGTTMPHALGTMSGEEKAKVIEALSHLLVSTGLIAESVPQSSDVRRGEELFHQVGCVACHDSQKEEQIAEYSVPLPSLEEKYSIPGLAAFLAEPLATRPGARMPDLNLSSDEARQIASYLLQGIDVEASLNYAYYEGSWQKLPELDEEKIVEEGKADSFDVTAFPRLDQFAVRYQAVLPITTAGKYKFYLGSDDGSRLVIDGKEVVRVDGVHPFQTQATTVELESGTREVLVDYFEYSGGEQLEVQIEGPGLSRQSIAGLVRPDLEALQRVEARFIVEPELVKEGQQYFVSMGCANCHELKVEGKTLAAETKATSLSDLDVTKGALRSLESTAPTASNATSTCPDYALDETQQDHLATFVKSVQASSNDIAIDHHDASLKVHQTFLTMNCYACHARDEIGGAPRDREAWFVGTEPEMGDEGRLPPPLTGVGAKLKESWLNEVIGKGAKVRPYMLTRMPSFGNGTVEQLVGPLRELDKLQQSHPEFEINETDRRVKVVGRFLAGRKGLSCIQCHTWGDIRSTGVQAMSLTTMTSRLDKDWFQLYMRDPIEFRPGTRMPNSFPRGKTFFTQYLDGNVDAQIHALWEYLEDGVEAAQPIGLENPGILLEPTDEPIVYRGFIVGAGTRAIAVGFPEKAHLVFDSNRSTLVKLWQGAFFDAAMHWRGRGQGWADPAGENILELNDAPLLAKLSEPTKPWPKSDERADGRFVGYQFDQARQPTFIYSLAGIDVEDTFAADDETEYPRMSRTLSFQGPAESTVWLLAGRGDKISNEQEGLFLIDDWQLKVAADKPGQVIESADGFELRVPIEFDKQGQAQVELSYRW